MTDKPPAPSLEQVLSGMQSGEKLDVNHETGMFKVHYTDEQALGDNGLPARGYTVGYYHVHGPRPNDYTYFRHSPHGPTLMGAKPYAARQAAEHISKHVMKSVFKDRRG